MAATRRGRDSASGLAIADRIAGLLRAPLALRSEPGRGTMFAVAVPTAAPQPRDPGVRCRSARVCPACTC